MKKHLKLTITVVSIVAFLAGCQDEKIEFTQDNIQEIGTEQKMPLKVQQQVNDIFTYWAQEFPNADLQPISIEAPRKITNENEKLAVVNNILSQDGYYATYDGERLSSLRVFTIGEIKNAEAFRANTRTVINERVAVGQGFATFNWKYKGKEFSTLYIYDDEGFVYEPMAASIRVKENNLTDAKSEWIHNFDINWIWGGKSGHVKIRHDANCNGTHLTSHSGWSDAYLNLGNAQARIIDNGAIYSKGSASWGYAWATGTITASVSTNWSASGNYQGVPWQGEVNASISGTFGTGGSAQGFHAITCP